MHSIEYKLEQFLTDKTNRGDLKRFADELSKRLKEALVSRFEQPKEEPFTLRMSNIGLPLRQLCLMRDYGRVPISNEFSVSGFYGVMVESFMLFLLKSSGVNVEEVNKKVELKLSNYIIPGELDLIINGAVWDVKSASPYSYEHKFIDYKSIEADDPFGYMGQLFGYSMADDKPVGGWIVFNKSNGKFKVIPIPIEVQAAYRQKYKAEFEHKADYILNNKAAPACEGVVDEVFYKKKTGNKVLNYACEWCNHKDKCHTGLLKLPSLVSSAKDKPFKYYVEIDEKFKLCV